MANFVEIDQPVYDWTKGVYVIERTDPVEGGAEGVSNRQGRELTARTRDLHTRTSTLETQQPIKHEATLRSAKEYTDQQVGIEVQARNNADAATLQSAKDYAQRIVDGLVDSAPGSLDTLKELAAALGNDANFSTTILNTLATKVDNSDGRLTNAREAVGGWSETLYNQLNGAKMKIWCGSQAQYDATSKQSDTLYFIQ